MLKELILENFKGFRGIHRVPLSRITLLYGENSAGKSSILRAMQLFSHVLGSSKSPLAGLPFNENDNLTTSFRQTINHDGACKHLGVGLVHNHQKTHWDFPLSPDVRLHFRFKGGDFKKIEAPKYYQHNLDNHLIQVTLGAEKFAREPVVFERVDPRVFRDFSLAEAQTELCMTELLNKLSFDMDIHGGLPELKSEEDLKKKIDQGNRADKIKSALKEKVRFFLDPRTLPSVHDYLVLKIFNDNSVEALSEMTTGYCDLVIDSFEDETPLDNGNLGISSFIKLRNFVQKSSFTGVARHLLLILAINPGIKHHPEITFSVDTMSLASDFPELTPDTIDNLSQLLRFMDHLGENLEGRHAISYLGPQRPGPNSFFFRNDVTSNLTSNEAALDFIYPYTDREFSATNKWLEKLKIPYSVRIESTGNRFTGPIDSLVLKNTRTGSEHAMHDVGFGISQLLPILLKGENLGENLGEEYEQYIFLEQPEIHLHPRLQANLADFFIETTGMDGANQHHQWIIETHSEALMHRFQRRIREGKLSPDEVSVLYVGSLEEKGSFIVPLRLNQSGEFIDEWPGGFFEDEFDDIFDLGL